MKLLHHLDFWGWAYVVGILWDPLMQCLRSPELGVIGNLPYLSYVGYPDVVVS